MTLAKPPQLSDKDYSGNTIFEEACGRENLEGLNFLLYECKYNVNSKEKSKVKSYRCPDSSGYIGVIEKRDFFFKMSIEMNEFVNNKAKKYIDIKKMLYLKQNMTKIKNKLNYLKK